MPLKDVLPAALSTGIDFVTGIYNRSQERKEYDRMLRYNHPKNQMKRLREAGLSPWLMYGQGTPGNANAPAPASALPGVSQGIDRYIGWKNFTNEQRMFKVQLANQLTQGGVMYGQDRSLFLDNVRKQLELYSDYPALVNNLERNIDPSMVEGSFRRKMNELKLSASLESVKRIQEAIKGMSSENVVKSVKARYASDFGMVGGDWTQGLGLIKSLPSFFRSRAKSSIARDTYDYYKHGKRITYKP